MFSNDIIHLHQIQPFERNVPAPFCVESKRIVKVRLRKPADADCHAHEVHKPDGGHRAGYRDTSVAKVQHPLRDRRAGHAAIPCPG